MLDSQCHVQFRWCETDSVEYQRKKEKCLAQLDHRLGSNVSKNLLCSIPAAGTHDTTSGMAGSAAQVKASQRRAMISPTGNRSHEVELIQVHGSLHDVPAR